MVSSIVREEAVGDGATARAIGGDAVRRSTKGNGNPHTEVTMGIIEVLRTIVATRSVRMGLGEALHFPDETEPGTDPRLEWVAIV